jgi:hypothetical protein
MTNIRVWAFSGIAAVALAVGALMASGAVSSAQESSTTPTPAATTAPSGSSDATATPAPSGSSGGTATPAPGKSDHNCPNMGTGTSSGSSTAPTRSRSVTNGTSGGA